MGSPRTFLLLLPLICAIGNAPTASADSLANLLRKTASIADDVPLKGSDDALSRLRRMRRITPSTESLEAATAAGIRNADDARAAGVLVDGAKRIESAIPDLQVRSELLSIRGSDAFQAAGLRKTAAEDLIFLHHYLARRDLKLPTGLQSPSMADFARITSNDGQWRFWETYVQPNKAAWAGGAALAAYLSAPEMWHDAAGNITAGGIKLAADLGGEILASILNQIAESGEDLGDRVKDELENLGTKSFIASLGSIAIVGAISIMLLASLRRKLFAIARRLVIGTPRAPGGRDSF